MLKIDNCKKFVVEQNTNKIIIIRKNSLYKELIRPANTKASTQLIVPSVVDKKCEYLFEIY